MNIKVVLGIFLPMVLIVFLVILSSSGVGFSVEKENVESVQFSSLFTDKNSPKDNVPVQMITLTNDFFLPRRYELPKLVACLNDKEGIKELQNIPVKYKEGLYSSSDVPKFDKVIFDYNYRLKQSIELPVESKKQVRILVQSKYLYNYNTTIDSYREYDELLLIESKETNRYNSCQRLESEEISAATRITILK